MRPAGTFALALFMLLCAALPGGTAERDVRVGFLYNSPASEEGWAYAHDQGRRALDSLPGVSTFFVESISEGPESERVVMEMARRGYDIIFTTSYGYEETTRAVARRFPRTTFLHCSGDSTASNLSAYFGRMYEARFLTGLVAGAMTKKDIIGYVAAYPIPEVIRGINAFTLGVRTINPKATVRVSWTRTWYDPDVEGVAAKTLIASGVDVIAQHQDSPAAQQQAEKQGVYSIGYNFSMGSAAPKAHLVAAVWNWAPFYKTVVAKVRAGQWESGNYWLGLKDGIVDLSEFNDVVPARIRATVQHYKNEIISGNYVVFKGPVTDQGGALRIAKDVKPSDPFLRNMNWFVQGVVGTPQ